MRAIEEDIDETARCLIRWQWRVEERKGSLRVSLVQQNK